MDLKNFGLGLALLLAMAVVLIAVFASGFYASIFMRADLLKAKDYGLIHTIESFKQEVADLNFIFEIKKGKIARVYNHSDNSTVEGESFGIPK